MVLRGTHTGLCVVHALSAPEFRHGPRVMEGDEMEFWLPTIGHFLVKKKVKTSQKLPNQGGKAKR